MQKIRDNYLNELSLTETQIQGIESLLSLYNVSPEKKKSALEDQRRLVRQRDLIKAKLYGDGKAKGIIKNIELKSSELLAKGVVDRNNIINAIAAEQKTLARYEKELSNDGKVDIVAKTKDVQLLEIYLMETATLSRQELYDSIEKFKTIEFNLS